MRLILSIALAIAFAATALTVETKTAEAGYHHYYLCWNTTDGTTSCRRMPRRYHVPGVPKPRPGDAGVDFRLTRMIIACLRPLIDTSGMRPGQYATVYAPKPGL